MSVGSDPGYTLLELLTVIVILSLIMLVVPSVYGQLVPGYQVRQLAYDVANISREMREQARLTRTVTGFGYTEGGSFYALDARVLSIPETVTVSFARSIPWVTVEDGKVEFYPSGASSGGIFTFTRGGVSVDLVIDWMSGAIKVQQ